MARTGLIRGENTEQWIPFGAGAHVCIGQFFAMMFAKSALHQLLSNYRFELAADKELDLNVMPTTYPKDGLRMRLFPLTDADRAVPKEVRPPAAAQQCPLRRAELS